MDVKTINVAFMDGKYEMAAREYGEEAKNGNAECAHNYAYCLLYGIGVEKDEKMAKSFFTFATSHIGEASYNLAVMYLHGTGVKRNYKKAVEYMEDAAEKGIIEAQLYLGIAHTMGQVFEPDVVSISIIPFHTPNYRTEGLLIEGDVEYDPNNEDMQMAAIRQDLHAAFYWFRRAARHPGDYAEDFARKGKYLYARCFLDGVGVDFNLNRANALMLLAAAEGSEDALTYLQTEAPYVLASVEDKVLLNKIKSFERLG